MNGNSPDDRDILNMGAAELAAFRQDYGSGNLARALRAISARPTYR
jgi:hypothetical protein